MLGALDSSHSHYMHVGSGCVFPCMCGVYAYMCKNAYRGLKSRPSVITSWFSTYALRQGLSMNLELINLAIWAER